MKKIKIGAFALATLLSLGCFASCNLGGDSSSPLGNSQGETTKTWATNFKGIITETGNDGYVYKNYYINKNNWILGENVVLGTYSDGRARDYLRFLDCNNRSLFGPRVRYEDFVCRFTVIMNDIELAEAGASFGLSFNRKTLYSYANDCAGVLFVKSDMGTAVRATQGVLDKAKSGSIWLQYEEENAVDLWAEKNAKYDFMIVKSGDTAQLYFAKAGDTEGMKILRATLSGVSGEGYVAMSGIMGVNFNLDNFGVWDLNEADDFGDYTTNGSVGISDGKAVIGRGGSLLSSKAEGDVSVSYDLKVTAGNSFALTLDKEQICFTADGKITGSKGLSLVSSASVDFSVFAQGATVRLRRMDGRIYVDVIGKDGYYTQAVFDGASQQSSVGLTAGEDASLIVSTVSSISLTKTVDIPTKDYDPNVDLDPMRPKDISFNDYYGVNE